MKRDIDEQKFKDAVNKSHSIADVLRNLNRCPYGGAGYRYVKQKISEYDVDISHFSEKVWNKDKTFDPLPKIPIEEILVENRYFNTNQLRKRLIASGLKEHKCEICNNSEWNEKPIPLELHHINGNNNDNRIENLQILCPNCHAQTDNYCGKNKSKSGKHIKKITTDVIKEKKTKICPICNNLFIQSEHNQIYCSSECYHISTRKVISEEDIKNILNLFRIYNSFEGVGRYLNISGNAVRKRCERLGLPTHIEEIKELIKPSY